MFLSDALAGLEDMGLDFAVRIGELVPHRLGKFRLGTTRWVACASPEYLRQRGAPRFPDDLVEHDCVAYVSPASGRPHDWQFSPGKDSWSFKVGKTARQVLDHCDALGDAAVAGAGVIYLHDYAVKVHLDDGTLVRVLEDFHTPGRSIHAVYPAQRPLSKMSETLVQHVISRLDRLAAGPQKYRLVCTIGFPNIRQRPAPPCSSGAGELPWLDLRQAAVYEKLDSGNVATIVGREEKSGGCQLLRPTDAAERGCSGELRSKIIGFRRR